MFDQGRARLGWAIVAVCAVALTLTPAAGAAEPGGGSGGIIAGMGLLVLQIGLVLIAAWGLGALFQKFGAPRVLGELVAGMLIGPFLLGGLSLTWLGFPHGIFPTPLAGVFPVSNELYGFATLGSIVLLFVAGIETNIETFLRYSGAGFAVGVGGVVVSFIGGDLLAVWAGPTLFGGEFAWYQPLPLFMGVLCTATSVGISARILSDRQKMDSPVGTTILSAAVIDDVLGIVALAIVLGISRGEDLGWKGIGFVTFKAVAVWLGFTAAGLVFAPRLGHLLRRFRDPVTISIMALALTLILAAFFDRSGLALIIGAYVMGLSLARTDLAYMIRSSLTPIHQLLVPMFFCIMGMLIDVSKFGDEKTLIFGLVFTGVAVAAKLLGCGLPPLFFNFNWRGALQVGVGMVPRCEVALIVAGIGIAEGVLQDKAFSTAILMIFLTTIITPPVLNRLLAGTRPVLVRDTTPRSHRRQIVYNMPNAETADFVLNHLVAGFEREGFFVYHMALPDQFFKICKEETIITLRCSAKTLTFDCADADLTFIHTLYYEVLADMGHIVKSLQVFVDRDAVGKLILAADHKRHSRAEAAVAAGIIRAAIVEIDLKAGTKPGIIEEMVDLMIASGRVEPANRATVLADLMERENNISTGMEEGIALPHARTDAVDQIECLIGIKAAGIDFQSLDKQPSRIFILTLAPRQAAAAYIQYMAEVSKFLADTKNQHRVLACRTNDELYRTFVENI
ncbi:MAG: cation:proton antiporter [Planctomycetota bacterium]